jgi:hypothetical protein
MSENNDPMTAGTPVAGAINSPVAPPALPPVTIAFVIDGVVVDVLHTDERLAAIFLSEPKVVDITPEDGMQKVFVDYLYNDETNTFSAPVQETESPE